MADEPDTGVTTDTANSEAAKWRRQLRGVEVERDQLAARLDAADRREVERLAADRFQDPRDVFAVTSIDAMRAEDGTVDSEKVEAELTRIATDRPHWVKPPPAPEPETPPWPDVHHGPRASPEPPPPSFGEMLRDQGRGR
jgi:hypothetical protein